MRLRTFFYSIWWFPMQFSIQYRSHKRGRKPCENWFLTFSGKVQTFIHETFQPLMVGSGKSTFRIKSNVISKNVIICWKNKKDINNMKIVFWQTFLWSLGNWPKWYCRVQTAEMEVLFRKCYFYRTYFRKFCSFKLHSKKTNYQFKYKFL